MEVSSYTLMVESTGEEANSAKTRNEMIKFTTRIWKHSVITKKNNLKTQLLVPISANISIRCKDDDAKGEKHSEQSRIDKYMKCDSLPRISRIVETDSIFWKKLA